MGYLSSYVIMHWLFHRAGAIRFASQQHGHESLQDGLALLCSLISHELSCCADTLELLCSRFRSHIKSIGVIH